MEVCESMRFLQAAQPCQVRTRKQRWRRRCPIFDVLVVLPVTASQVVADLQIDLDGLFPWPQRHRNRRQTIAQPDGPNAGFGKLGRLAHDHRIIGRRRQRLAHRALRAAAQQVYLDETRAAGQLFAPLGEIGVAVLTWRLIARA